MDPVRSDSPPADVGPADRRSTATLVEPTTPPAAGRVKQTERPHPLTPFIRGWIVFVAILLGLGREMIPDGSNDRGFDLRNLTWVLPVAGAAVLLAAVAGFAGWYFTRFVIDDEEVRVETGALFKNSKKVPFERLQSVDIIQPLAARLFGLAELRLEAGTSDGTIKLRYLRRTKAAQLREYLLARAHGHAARVSDRGADASALTDLSPADRPIVRVTPQRLVVGFILSTEWLVSVAVAVVLVVTSAFHVTVFALSGLVPLAVGIVSMISRRLIAMFGFTLAESPRGLRITRGLTNLTSQSVPINRIQGVKITQPLLWRAVGWYRVDVDIVGYTRSDNENNESSATSVLLPVATEQEVELAVGRVLPGFDLDGIELHRMPSRARWIRWYDFWTLRYGWNDRLIVTEQGWLTHVRNVVPHAKTQSVRVLQGPLQRWLRLADVHIDTAKGPVHAVAHQVDAAAARELALTQLDRARAARAAEREGVPVRDADPHEAQHIAAILDRFHIGADRFLGSGGETQVFALDDTRVLRIYRGVHDPDDHTVDDLRRLYASWPAPGSAQQTSPIEVPAIFEVGQLDGRSYTVDRRFSGMNFSVWLRTATLDERHIALVSFLEATLQVQTLPSPVAGFARLVGQGAPRRFDTAVELLDDMLARPTAHSRAQLSADLPEAAQVWDRLHVDLAQRQVEPKLVHGDICPPNAYVSTASGQPVITGFGDFSPHTVHGDPFMDVAGAVAFLELESHEDAAADAVWLEARAVDKLGPEVSHWIAVYRRFYGFYFSDTAEFDPALYAWCLRQLRT